MGTLQGRDMEGIAEPWLQTMPQLQLCEGSKNSLSRLGQASLLQEGVLQGYAMSEYLNTSTDLSDWQKVSIKNA